MLPPSQPRELRVEHVLARFKPLHPKTKLIVPLTTEEFWRLVAALTGPARLRARGRVMLYLLFDTGIRASDLAKIRLGDMDLGAGHGQTGNGASRTRFATCESHGTSGTTPCAELPRCGTVHLTPTVGDRALTRWPSGTRLRRRSGWPAIS